MAFSDLTPWASRPQALSPRSREEADPFQVLGREMNRLFDSFSRGFGFPAAARGGQWSGTWPRVEVSETDAEVKVVAELPGLEEKDVELTLRDGVLTIKGEKVSQSKGALYSERWHGQFQRSIQVGPAVDPDKVGAGFKNGVLSVTLVKRPEAQAQVKRIPIGNA